jgi:hypothetical protein
MVSSKLLSKITNDRIGQGSSNEKKIRERIDVKDNITLAKLDTKTKEVG